MVLLVESERNESAHASLSLYADENLWISLKAYVSVRTWRHKE